MEKIQWVDWSPEAFERAREEGRLILLDIGAAWCHWCHVMDEESYANPEIIKLVNELYVPIRVDNDERPDINDRYNQGGWPTTAILTPEGFLVHGATYLPFPALKELLQKAREWYDENKGRLDQAAAEIAKKIAQEPPQPTPGEPTDFSADVIADIRMNADPVHGGFGSEQKFPHPAPISLAFAHHHSAGDVAILEFAEKTLHNMGEGLLDKEEGGLFRYSVTREWNVPHFEKNLDVNAQCLRNYIDAYRITGKQEYAATARKIIDYARRTLSDPSRGGFYASQDADIYDEDRMKILMTGEDYYTLSLEDRRNHGTPYVDKTVYTNWNGLMISSFLEAYHVLGLDECRKLALKTLRLLMDRCFDENSGTRHYLRDGESGGPLLLSDIVSLARANLDAYETTGENAYLEDARRLMGFAADKLSAKEGGFYDSVPDERLPQATRIRHRPLNENAQAAEVFGRLYNYTTHREYVRQAEGILAAFDGNVRALLSRNLGYFASEMALASRYVTDASTKVAVVGHSNDTRSRQLHEVAKRVYRPAKIVQLLDPAEDMALIEAMNYPTDERPVAHVCTEKGCLAPIGTPDELRAALETR